MTEHKYRLLCPFPYSNQSIEFKLSEAYLQSCTAFSPTKGRDSLTYTVSMETINDQDCSPFKSHSPQYLQLPESSQFLSENKNNVLGSNEQYDLSSRPIISIRIQCQSNQIVTQENQLQQNKCNVEKNIYQQQIKIENYRKNPFQKSILKVNNIILNQSENQHQYSPKSIVVKSQNNRKSMRMGKIMSRIHSQIKQQSLKCRKRAISGKIVPSPTKTSEAHRKRSNSFDRIQNYSSLQTQNIYRTLQQKSHENSVNPKIQYIGFKTEQTKNNFLCKTNSSSNVCCSPQMIRRKSDFIVQNTIKRRKNVQYDKFLSDRLSQLNKNPRNFGSAITSKDRIIRQRIKGSITCKKSESNIVNKYQKQLVFKRIKHKQNEVNKLFKKQKKQEKSYDSSSLQIIALKLNLTDRNSLISQSQQSRKKSTSQNQCNTKIPLKNYMRQENNIQIQKQNKYKELSNLEIDTKNMMEGVYKNKRAWRKTHENTGAKLFRL